MRILYLADVRFPLERANGIQTFETCSALAERGHEVTLGVRADTHRPPRDPFRFYGLAPQSGLRITYVAESPPLLRRVVYLGSAFLQATTTVRPDVVLTRDLGVAATLLTLPGPMRPPVVYESHGFAPVVAAALEDLLTEGRTASARKQTRLEVRERRVWQRADGYVAITRRLADDLGRRFGQRRIDVIPDGVRLDRRRVFEPPVPSGSPVVAYSGHCYPWKGVDVLLEALALVPDARGLIVGGHPAEADLPRLRERARSLDLHERVRFTGMVDPPQVSALLSEASILVLPNTATAISREYTSPLKLFEYMAAGRPIVASDLPALREIVNGESALLVPPGDARAIAAAIRRLADDPALATDLARTAFERVQRYSWARRAERLESVLIAASRRARVSGSR